MKRQNWMTMPSRAATSTNRPIIVVMQPPRPLAGAAGGLGAGGAPGAGASCVGEPTGGSGVAGPGVVGVVVGVGSLGAAEMPALG